MRWSIDRSLLLLDLSAGIHVVVDSSCTLNYTLYLSPRRHVCTRVTQSPPVCTRRVAYSSVGAFKMTTRPAGGSVLGDARALSGALSSRPAEASGHAEADGPAPDARLGGAAPRRGGGRGAGRPPQPPAAASAAAGPAPAWVRLEDVLRTTAAAEEALRGAGAEARTGAPLAGPVRYAASARSRVRAAKLTRAHSAEARWRRVSAR